MHDNYFKEKAVATGPRTSIVTSCHGPEGGSTHCIGSGAHNSSTT